VGKKKERRISVEFWLRGTPSPALLFSLSTMATGTGPPELEELVTGLQRSRVGGLQLSATEISYSLLKKEGGFLRRTLSLESAVFDEELRQALRNINRPRMVAIKLQGPLLQVPRLLLQETQPEASEAPEAKIASLVLDRESCTIFADIRSTALGSLLSQLMGAKEAPAIGCVDAEALAAVVKRANPKTLTITGCRIRKLPAKLLARSLRDSRVEELRMRDDKFTKRGFAVLMKVLPETLIRQLDLGLSRYTLKDVETLASVLSQTKLQILHLDFNRAIGNLGAQALAKSLPNSLVRKLSLKYSGLGKEGAEALAAILERSAITHLDVAHNQSLIGPAAVLLKEAVEARQARSFVLQMATKAAPEATDEDILELTFRTLAGSVVLVLLWDAKRAPAELVYEIHEKVRVRGLLKVVLPNGSLLDSKALARSVKRQLESHPPPCKRRRVV
jgi:hypothetical protein